MNYYEELGISSEASEEEIRKAFRNLSRMIHPDQHQDERLKQLAEVQMKRLTAIVDTLCHGDKRQAYDLSLQQPAPQAILPLGRIPPGPNRILPLICGIAFGGLLAYSLAVVSQPAPVPPMEEIPPTKSENAHPALSKDIAAHVSPRRTLSMTPDPKPIEKASRQEPPLEPMANPAPSAQTSLEAPLPATPTAPVVASLSPPSASTPKKMGGTWLYVPKARTTPKASKPSEKWEYSAEFVEMRVREEAGLIEGSYRSRYRIPDKPLQPEVSFRFQGSVDGKELDWEGPGGAKGKIQIELQGENTLLARWRATETGSVLSLASGSALLVRRID